MRVLVYSEAEADVERDDEVFALAYTLEVILYLLQLSLSQFLDSLGLLDSHSLHLPIDFVPQR